jgi:hypothetical protein
MMFSTKRDSQRFVFRLIQLGNSCIVEIMITILVLLKS